MTAERSQPRAGSLLYQVAKTRWDPSELNAAATTANVIRTSLQFHKDSTGAYKTMVFVEHKHA